MEIFEDICLNCVYLLFPIAIYLIISAYEKNMDKKLNNLIFEIALFSSIYLLFRHGKELTKFYPMIIFNIPLLMAYLKRKNKTAILISLLLIYYYHNNIGINYFNLIIEYLLYYVSYNYVINNKKESLGIIITNFVIIKSFILSFRTFFVYNPHNDILINFVEVIFTMSIFILMAFISLYLMKKGEEILDLNEVISKLNKEKELRKSLFKITHEIKNPIAVCKGYLDMINYNDKEKCEKYISIVKDQIDRTLILMDDFLDYTKVKLNKDEVDLYMLLEDSCDVVMPLLKKEKIRLDFNIPDKELYMDLDYSRMKQVLVNIFKNSIEAKDKKKKDRYIKLNVIEKVDEVVIKIKDNGIGMDKKTLRRVDEMFYTTKEKGTGLGVALSKEIVELHKGSIKYTSVKGKYTIVTIIFPIKKETKSLKNRNYCKA